MWAGGLGTSISPHHFITAAHIGGRKRSSVWKLAGINYAVDGPFYTNSNGTGGFFAALFDITGYYSSTGVSLTGPSSFYSSRISADLPFIYSVIPEPADAGLLTAVLLFCVATMGVWHRARASARCELGHLG